MRRVALIEHPHTLHHETGPVHPERADRIRAVLAEVERAGLDQTLTWMRPDPIALDQLESIHSKEHVRRVEEACLKNAGAIDAGDTIVCHDSFEAALLSAGAAVLAVDAVMAGRVEAAFSACRPPGHHATPSRAMGFCLFNNVALAARHAQRSHGLERVAIVDWDVHHGNGTQDIFFADGSVLFASLHQYPFYPGTGSVAEDGAGEGKGLTLNYPLDAGSGPEAFTHIFETSLLPALHAFKPQLLLISAGFDAHVDDPLGGLRLNAGAFGTLTTALRAAADTLCDGRIVSVLEGGYDLGGLGTSAAEHLRALQA
jgi:acetoin utilization deacetylase AcuC-like enzyme